MSQAHGALALQAGVLFIGRRSGRVRLAPFDLDGRRLGDGFTFGAEGDRADAGASISGLAVDDDRRLWVADPGASCLRIFTAFGRCLGVLCSSGNSLVEQCVDSAAVDDGGFSPPVAPAELGCPVAVAVRGTDVEQEAIVASAGRVRHALRTLPVAAEREGARQPASLRPGGDPRGRFLELTAVACRGDEIWACEAGAVPSPGLGGACGGGPAGRIQVFRRGDFHFSFGVGADWPANAGGSGGRAKGLALLSDGRALISIGGEERSALCLVSGTGRFLKLIAAAGKQEGCVWEPSSLAVEEGTTERATRVAVMDMDADRVQVFNLEGQCHGVFPELP
ncbi:MAG: hypothetical protein QF724_03430 [Planctomycetota bacterium]|nr:hypothetical protein [Planctomycetota bacterium]MDP6370083.1 hypothetical protein [Planctomycetota bacterium]MDP6837964.1 hypothetical protein [Planctomycetota bacterium]